MEINELLKDVKIDKERVLQSINQIAKLYDLKIEDLDISRKRLDPSEIYVAAVEECNINVAKELVNTKYKDTMPAPITILDYKGKYVLFKGSNRSVVFVLKGQDPDCIIVKLPENMPEPKIVLEAKQTLKEIIF